MKPRKNHTPGFKTKVVIEALQERETIQEIGKKYEIHPNQISTWKTQFLSRASNVFEKGISKNDVSVLPTTLLGDISGLLL